MSYSAARENYIRSSQNRRLQNDPKHYASYEDLEGTAARKPQHEEVPRRRIKSRAEILKRSKALKRQKAMFIVAGAVLAVAIIGLSTVLLAEMSTNKALKKEVGEKEASVEVLTLENDSLEYDISSSVDLNEIIRAATQDLGMVRSNVSQIVYYSTKNTEYLQQVAQVPLN